MVRGKERGKEREVEKREARICGGGKEAERRERSQ